MGTRIYSFVHFKMLFLFPFPILFFIRFCLSFNSSPFVPSSNSRVHAPKIPSAIFPGELYGLYGESLDLQSIFRLIFPHTFVGLCTSGLDSVLLYIPR